MRPGWVARAEVDSLRHRRTLVLCAALVTMIGLSGCGDSSADNEVVEPFPSGVVWIGDMETGDLSQFKEDRSGNVAGGARRPVVVTDPEFVRDGDHAVRLTIPGKSNGNGICCGSRSEIEPDIRALRPGDELYFGFSTLLGDGFPTEASWQVITQWKNDGDGSPPLELSIENGRYSLSGGADHPAGGQAFIEPIGPATTGRWVDWVFHIKFSPDPDVGFVEIWQGDDLVLPRYQPDTGTLYPDTEDEGTSYVKTGYYRNGDISAPGTIYFDSWRIGTSRDAVTRPRG